MRQRIGIVCKRAWNLYKNVKAAGDLLRLLGAGKLVVVVISATTSTALTVWAAMEGLPAPVLVIVFLAAFLVMLAIAFICILLWNAARMPEVTRSAQRSPVDLPASALPASAPKVILSAPRGGVELSVESLGQEAVNVRLVQIQSDNYYLRSEIIRYLKLGTPETLVLRCGSKQKQGSLVLQAFSAPSLFFNDQYPTYSGPDISGALEHELTQLNERQLVVNLDLAYSRISGAEHYRSTFRVRWDRFSQSIVDVEPVNMRIDADPPSTAPLNVIPDHSQLEFVQWHGGSSRNLPQKENGNPTWVSIRNNQIRVPDVAKNTTVRMEFVNANRTSVFTVPEAQWYIEKDFGNGIEGRGYKGSVDLEGGEEQSFVLFVTDAHSKIWVYKNGETPVGILDYGHWDINLSVSSDNAEGFEGKIGFTLTRNSLTPDQPAFTRLRGVKPRLGSS